MTILELLEAHSIAAFAGCDTLCACDRKWRTNIAWRAHVAEVLEAHQREAKAAALEEAAAELAQESDAASHMARKLSGDDNTRYHAYSSAYSVAAYKLENRAAQLKDQP